MSGLTIDPLEYYSEFGPITDPGEQALLFRELPADIHELCRIVQGLLLHIHWAEQYGVKVTEAGQEESNLRFVKKQLERILEIDPGPLTRDRPKEKRIMGTCRDFSTFLCALLRSRGIPARARCGFGTYFMPGHYEDHWICEYWKADDQRWVMVDPQLDEFQCRALGIKFDPGDVPHDQFIIAGRAWQMCRQGQAEPDNFGIFDMHGLWFVQGNLIRDLAALNKMELLPWDVWGMMKSADKDFNPEDLEYMDKKADLTLSGNQAFQKIRSVYEGDDGLKVPRVITSMRTAGPQNINLELYAASVKIP